MKKLVFVLVVALVGAGLSLPAYVKADAFPNKPITVIVPFAAGGSTDLLARAVEKIWPKYSKQPLIIVNRPGGGGVVGTEVVVRARPDGYTLYLGYGSGHDVVMPHLQKLPYDPFKDLVPVARLSVHSVAVVTGANAPFKTLSEMIAWAKRENKPLTAAVSTRAGSVDITLRGLAKAAGINITTVPFAGGAEAVAALAGGHLNIGGGHPSEVMPHIRAGRFRPLAMALPQRDAAMPTVPTMIEEGIKMYNWGSIKGVAAPAGTPREAITFLEETFRKICEDAEFKKLMTDLHQPIMYQNGADFGKFLVEAFADYGKLIKDLNISLN
jgi:tripartite-type tricarboxylate transporter receptor subunit TctC